MSERSQIDDGGTAFPTVNGRLGMTLRDWFAGQALAALPHIGCGADLNAQEIALASYQLADAMLAARQKKGGEA